MSYQALRALLNLTLADEFQRHSGLVGKTHNEILRPSPKFLSQFTVLLIFLL